MDKKLVHSFAFLPALFLVALLFTHAAAAQADEGYSAVMADTNPGAGTVTLTFSTSEPITDPAVAISSGGRIFRRQDVRAHEGVRACGSVVVRARRCA